MNTINRSLSYAKKVLLTFIVCWIAYCPSATAQKLDSLLGVIREHSFDDTTKVNLYSLTANCYENVNIDSMISTAKAGVKLAEQLHFRDGGARCQHQLGLGYLHLNDYDKAFSVFHSALDVFEKTGAYQRQANIYLAMADIYYRQAKYSLATEYYNKGIKIYDQINYPIGKGYALISIGGLCSDLGNYEEAINNYLRALTAFEQDNYVQGIKMTLTNIATVYSTLKNFPKAIEYIKKSEAVDDSKSTKEQQLLNLTNTGMVYDAMKDHQKALSAYYKAYELAESIKDDLWKNDCLLEIAKTYFGMGEYDTSLVKYTVALAGAEQLKDELMTVAANTGIGKILIKQGKLNDGIQYLLKAMATSRKANMKQNIFETALSLTNAYEQNHNLSEALAYYKVYFNYKDSLYSDKNNMHIQQMQFDYDLNKKETQIALLKKDKAIQEGKSEIQKLIIWASLSGVALLIVISVILYRSNQREKTSKQQILKQKEEIQLQARKLQELNQYKDKTFSVLSHDLRGPLQAFATIFQLFDQNELSAEEFAAMKPEVSRQLSSLNILLDNLLHWGKINMQGHRAGNHVTTNIYELVTQNVALLHQEADNKQLSLVNRVSADICAFCDPNEINIVIRNLIINAIKFTGMNGFVTISSVVNGNRLQLSISDTGVGMTQQQLDGLFTAAYNTTYGTDGEKGTGLGLILCSEFVKANNGTITVTSKVHEGSTFTITLPIS